MAVWLVLFNKLREQDSLSSFPLLLLPCFRLALVIYWCYLVLSLMTLSIGDNPLVWFHIVQTKAAFVNRTNLPYTLSNKKNTGVNNNAIATTCPNPQKSSCKIAVLTSRYEAGSDVLTRYGPGSNVWSSRSPLRSIIIRIEPHARAVASHAILGFK